jgi:hypothetical protein
MMIFNLLMIRHTELNLYVNAERLDYKMVI